MSITKKKSMSDIRRETEIKPRKLLYYWPEKNRFYISDERRRKLAFEGLKKGKSYTIWFAFLKIPSECVLVGAY